MNLLCISGNGTSFEGSIELHINDNSKAINDKAIDVLRDPKLFLITLVATIAVSTQLLAYFGLTLKSGPARQEGTANIQLRNVIYRNIDVKFAAASNILGRLI